MAVLVKKYRKNLLFKNVADGKVAATVIINNYGKLTNKTILMNEDKMTLRFNGEKYDVHEVDGRFMIFKDNIVTEVDDVLSEVNGKFTISTSIETSVSQKKFNLKIMLLPLKASYNTNTLITKTYNTTDIHYNFAIKETNGYVGYEEIFEQNNIIEEITKLYKEKYKIINEDKFRNLIKDLPRLLTIIKSLDFKILLVKLNMMPKTELHHAFVLDYNFEKDIIDEASKKNYFLRTHWL